jgi:hypothetical protein
MQIEFKILIEFQHSLFFLFIILSHFYHAFILYVLKISFCLFLYNLPGWIFSSSPLTTTTTFSPLLCFSQKTTCLYDCRTLDIIIKAIHNYIF